MIDKSKFKSLTSFLDMLWILLAGFAVMFMIAYLLIQPVAKEADIIKRAEYIIILEWHPESTDDIDLWVRNPAGKIVSFRNKTADYMNLEKDDLGSKNDTIIDEYGNKKVLKINREIVTLRGVIAGEYEVMVHVYRKDSSNPMSFSVEVIKINPYTVVYGHKDVYTTRGQELSVVRFTVNKKSNFISFNNLKSDFIKGRPVEVNIYEDTRPII